MKTIDHSFAGDGSELNTSFSVPGAHCEMGDNIYPITHSITTWYTADEFTAEWCHRIQTTGVFVDGIRQRLLAGGLDARQALDLLAPDGPTHIDARLRGDVDQVCALLKSDGHARNAKALRACMNEFQHAINDLRNHDLLGIPRNSKGGTREPAQRASAPA